ncbi:MAG: hypothetical protein DWB99_06560 [Candidatus Poseidoniales archaeon]|nr:MAG: hypothetical protein DWB99_06560 [Candidatus Poseidoniales archaeon]|tara:strand:+ start:391 stop:618 length:228 start_codon:yes stop_codon:yes gene_type:complete
MSSDWKLKLDIQSRNNECTEALSSALITDCEINWSGDSFNILIEESKAKDLRAMWNTRVRGLIAVDSLLEVIDEY